MSKNIVILSDGTGQEGGKGQISNIFKLYKQLGENTNEQVRFYDKGVGTDWRKIFGNAVGRGFAHNVLECYEFLSKNYEDGDKIFLFGFSRGAATVRSLSGFICAFGVIPSSNTQLIDKAWDIYKIPDKTERKTKIIEFLATQETQMSEIQFLGCYDTVAALGHPYKWVSKVIDKFPFWKHRFHDFKLSNYVQNAYQALAIDDKRKTFHPILWDADSNQNIKQVWFCGMHSDVGGGYKDSALADIPFVWLKNMAVKHELIIYPPDVVTINGDVNGEMHDSMTLFYRDKQRFWDTERSDKPILHTSVLHRKKNIKNKDKPPYKPWVLGHDYEIEG